MFLNKLKPTLLYDIYIIAKASPSDDINRPNRYKINRYNILSPINDMGKKVNL